MGNSSSFVAKPDAANGSFKKISNSPNDFWMNKRGFASHNQSSLRVTRLRSLVLAFGVVILLLAATLLMVLQNMKQAQTVREAANTPPPEAPPVEEVRAAKTDMVPVAAASVPHLVEILVAAQKIEKGTGIAPDMLKTIRVAEADVPEGALQSWQQAEILGKFSAQQIEANFPLTSTVLREDRQEQIIPFEIPSGYRAASIVLDPRANVEGFARPGTYVDVLWYDQKDEGRVITLLTGKKVLSLGGSIAGTVSDKAPQTAVGTVTLLVTKREAKVLELARNTGSLSLSLAGEGEDKDAEADLPVTLSDIIHKQDPQPPKQLRVDGVLEMVNPESGKSVKYVLSENGWVDTAAESTKEEVSGSPEVKKSWLGKQGNATLPEYARGLLLRNKQ